MEIYWISTMHIGFLKPFTILYKSSNTPLIYLILFQNMYTKTSTDVCRRIQLTTHTLPRLKWRCLCIGNPECMQCRYTIPMVLQRKRKHISYVWPVYFLESWPPYNPVSKKTIFSKKLHPSFEQSLVQFSVSAWRRCLRENSMNPMI